MRRDGRWSVSIRVRAVLSVGILLGFGSIGTTAYWTDDSALTVGTVDSGEIHLDLFDAFQTKPESHTWATMTLAHMVPGSSRAQVVPITNNSVGAVDLDYVVLASATPGLLPHLQLTLQLGGSSNNTTCSGGTLIGNANTPLSSTPVTVGSAVTGLEPGQTDQLCVQVRLAPNAPNAMQGQSSTVTLEFVGTQAQ